MAVLSLKHMIRFLVLPLLLCFYKMHSNSLGVLSSVHWEYNTVHLTLTLEGYIKQWICWCWVNHLTNHAFFPLWDTAFFIGYCIFTWEAYIITIVVRLPSIQQIFIGLHSGLDTVLGVEDRVMEKQRSLLLLKQNSAIKC